MPPTRHLPKYTARLAVLAFALGFVGFAAYHRDHSWPDHIFHTLQLYVLGYVFDPVAKSIPVTLEVARFLAPLSLAMGTAWALLRVFSDSGHSLLLRFANDHLIIAGENPAAIRLIEDALTLKRKVVVIDPSGGNPNIDELRRRHVVVISGQMDDPRVLERCRVHRASHLIAFGHDGATNVHTVIHAIHLTNRKRSRGRVVRPIRLGNLQCYAHVTDHRLRAAFKENNTFQDSRDRADIYLFSLYESTARGAVSDHPLEVDESKNLVAQPEVVILGQGDEALPFFLHAARISHFKTRKNLRVTWFSHEAVALKVSLRHRFPQLEQVVDVNIVPVAGYAPESYAAALSETADIPSTDTFTNIVCAVGCDTDNFILAQHLQNLLDPKICRILVHVAKDPDLASLVATLEDDATPATYPIGLPEQVGTWQAVTRPELERSARAIHDNYIFGESSRENLESRENASVVAWEKLPEHLRDQNRFQADHLPVKLRAVGVDPKSPPTRDNLATLLEADIEILGEMEHRRWLAAHILAGYRYGEIKDKALKTNPTILPWKDLAESERDKDREAIRSIPDIVERIRNP